MKRMMMVVAMTVMGFALSACADVVVTDVTAKQRYPWNGLVDITCKVAGINGTTNGLKFAIAAMMSDSGKTRNVSHFWVVQGGMNSTDREVHVNGDYRLLWDARADLGTVRCTNMVMRVNFDVHEKVQLWKDGPYWAATNIGADEPWEYGCYFKWGDIVGYKREGNAWVATDGSSDNFSFESSNMSTNITPETLLSEGLITADNVLTSEHDAAQVLWGCGWRMPTSQELYDLCYDNCDWTWGTMNGENGYVVRGRGDYASNSIFLPCAGLAAETSLYADGSGGCYWSSVLGWDCGYSWYLDFHSNGFDTYGSGFRDNGFPIRPVTNGAMMETGASSPFLLDTAEGTRIAQEVETIAYSTTWNNGDTVRVAADDMTLKEVVTPASGDVAWNAAIAGIGCHTLTHTVGGETLTARFAVLGEDVAVHAGTLGTSETWGTSKTHLITEPLAIPSGVSLVIDAGAVVKFMPGTSLTVSGGGSCTARGVTFTHVNDDTIGGDTLLDGSDVVAKMGDYTITGSITDDDSTEYRYMPPQPLMSSVLSNTRLRGYRTYIASNSVTVASGVTLTLQPGTIIKFNTGCQLTINGTLDAQGTRAAPIVFTSLKDDVHGGDTNGDGEKTYPYAGDWHQIRVPGTANFNYCHVLYSASMGNYGAVEAYGGAVNFGNSEIAHAKYECVNAHNDGIFTAHNSVFRDSPLGFGYYGSGRVKACNCVFSDLSVAVRQSGKTLTNCIFYRCLAFTDQSGDDSKYNHCVFFNPVGYGAQSYAKCGSNDNVWGDPLFEDPDDDDVGVAFRIAANSPCVDAGDAASAPECDWHGQPRNGAPDIGMNEVQGDTGTGYDLAAVEVNAQAAQYIVGDTVMISYDVANVGRFSVADQWHDALYLVSSSSGRQYALGEPLNPGALGAGGSRSYDLQFAVPVLPVGKYRLRLVVNSRRMDVPEGSATENNVVLSEAEIEIVAESASALDGASGSVAAGASAVCEFDLPSGSGDKLMRVSSSAGGTTLYVRSGLGFLPVDAASGTALLFSGGEAWLSVPAGTEKVWLVLDNAGAAAASYEVDFHDGSLTLTDVSPSAIPSSGSVTLEIAGAGFTDDCAVSFTGAGAVAPLAVKRVSTGLLAVTVDAASFGAGNTYSVVVEKGDETKTLQNALTVAQVPGEAKFWAKLDVPSSMRQGRLMETCFIEYGNSGTVDMLSPVLQVAMTGDGTLGYIGGLSGLKTLQFVAAGDAGSAGILRAGSSHRIRFAIRAGASNKISLHTSEGSGYAPAPWTNAAEYLSDLSAAATRLGLAGIDATDYTAVHEFAEREHSGDDGGSIVDGFLLDTDGCAVADVKLRLEATNAIYAVTTDARGHFAITGVEPGKYGFKLDGRRVDGDESIIVPAGEDVSGINLRLGNSVNCRLVAAGFYDGFVISLRDRKTQESFEFLDVGDSQFVASGLPNGHYSVTVEDGLGNLWVGGFVVDGSENATVLFAEASNSVSISGTIEMDGDFDVRFVALTSAETEKYVAVDNDMNTFAFDDLAPGGYSVTLFCGKSDNIAKVDIGDFELSSGERTNVVGGVSTTAVYLPEASLSSKGSITSKGILEFLLGPDKVQEEYLARVKEFEDELNAHRPIAPAGEYACEHNIGKYESDESLWREHFNFVLQYKKGATKTSMWKSIADWFRLGHELFNLTFDVLVEIYTKGKMLVWKMAVRDVLIILEGWAFDDLAEVLEDANGKPISRNDYDAAYAALSEMEKNADRVNNAIKVLRLGQYSIQKVAGWRLRSSIGYTSSFMKNGAGAFLGKMGAAFTLSKDLIDTYDSAKRYYDSVGDLNQAYDDMAYLTYQLDVHEKTFKKQWHDFNNYPLCCKQLYPEDPYDPPVDDATPNVPKSCDPNEMVGEDGVGDARYVTPGQELTYTIYFENKAGFDIADAQEVRVTNPLSEWLDWSTFEMREMAFNNQCDVTLDRVANGTSEVQMNGTNKYVRTTVECDAEEGVVLWYMRVYDPNGDSEGYPTDMSGFLPSNDDTHRGEGHITYRIKVRDDAPAKVVITNSAVIVFDGNPPIETDPAWWNTVSLPGGGAQFVDREIVVNEGENAIIRISGSGEEPGGGNVRLYLAYNTAVAADIDLKKALEWNVYGTPSGEVKFPRLLTWGSGQAGENVIEIPIKADKAVEGDEFFTLQLADAHGQSLGEGRVCTVIVHDPGYDELAAKIANGTAAKAEQTAWDKLQNANVPYIRGVADSAERGKVTGSGFCAEGKKVTLKATANKGFVFAGWTTEQIPLDGGRLVIGAQNYVATTPSLVIDRTAKPAKGSAKSTTLTDVDGDATYYACFITAEEDKAAIAAAVDGWALEPWVSKTETHALATNIWAGVYLEWPVAASALSATTVKVAGLPSGLKFAAKPVTAKVGSGKAAVLVTNVPANTIYGAPSAASKIDAKTGAAKPSAVKVTVTTAGKSSQTYQIDTAVDALPAWAKGSFAGGGFGEAVMPCGQVALTVSAAGKVGGKAMGDGLTYTLAAPYYSGFDMVDGESNFLAEVTASWSYKEGSRTVKANDVVQMAVRDNGIGGLASVEDWFEAYAVNWKDEHWNAIGKSFDKKTQAYAILADGTFSENEEDLTSALGADVVGRVTLKFKANGTATAAGEFVTAHDAQKDKYATAKATGSATLVPVDKEHGALFIYLTPKGLPPHARCIDVPWPEW